MRRMSTVMVGMALAVSACSGAAQTASPVPATPGPVPATAAPATAAPATAAPSPTLLPIAAAVTFDGQSCTYSGPTVIPLNAEVTFTMTNTPAAIQAAGGAAALIVMPVVDGTTWEFIVADLAATQSIADAEPAYAFLPGIGYKAIQILYPDTGSQTLRVVPTMDLDYLVMCGTGPDKTDEGFPAILLEILPKA